MNGINKVILIGTVATQVQLTYENAAPFVNFQLVTTDYVTRNGVKVEKREFHTILMWWQLAENAATLLTQGKLVYLEGKCRTKTYDDGDGIVRYATEVEAGSFTLVGRKADFVRL